MSAVANFLQAAAERGKPEMDQWGRYKLVDPETGEIRGRTRVTTLAQTLADTFGLAKWQIRMTAIGLAHNPELLAGVAANASIDQDNKALDKLCDEAGVRAGTRLRADLGTHLHHFAELVDRGAEPVIPDPYDRDIAAYRKTMAEAGVVTRHEMIERVVLLNSLDIAGTFDRVVELPGLGLVVADIKTGDDLSYKAPEISVQLACYANADLLWTPSGYEPMPAVRKDLGLIIHLPVEQATCTLLLIDIAAGWEMVQTCLDVRAWRKRTDLISPYTGPAAAKPAEPAKPAEVAGLGGLDQEWAVQRLAALFDHVTQLERTDELAEIIQAGWPAELPPKPPWTADQLEQLSDQLDALEAHFGQPFGDSQPSVKAGLVPEAKPDEYVMVDVAPQRTVTDRSPRTARRDVEGLSSVFAMLTDNESDTLRQWSREAQQSGNPWDVAPDGTMTERVWSIARAAYVCACRFGEAGVVGQHTRAALSLVLDMPWEPTWQVGAVLGVLTQDEAVQLAFVADAWASKDRDARAAIERVAATIEPF